MITLLLDTSSTKLGIGIAKDNILIDSIFYEAWQKQSELLVPEIDKILSKNKLDAKSINEIIVSIGPGSYTGVRIALTVAKTMGVCLNIPIYPVSSLAILKNSNDFSICLMNARSGRSYIGVYKDKEVIIKDKIYTNDEVIKYIDSHKGYHVCGDCSYLGIEGENNNIFVQMLSLKDKPCENILALKPVYLKD